MFVGVCVFSAIKLIRPNWSCEKKRENASRTAIPWEIVALEYGYDLWLCHGNQWMHCKFFHDDIEL